MSAENVARCHACPTPSMVLLRALAAMARWAHGRSAPVVTAAIHGTRTAAVPRPRHARTLPEYQLPRISSAETCVVARSVAQKARSLRVVAALLSDRSVQPRPRLGLRE